MQNKSVVSKVAEERMHTLLLLADARAKERTEQGSRLEKRYVLLARRISTHYRIRLPAEFRSRICKSCNNLLIPGINCTARAASGKGYIVYACECGHERHIFYKKSKQKAAAKK